MNNKSIIDDIDEKLNKTNNFDEICKLIMFQTDYNKSTDEKMTKLIEHNYKCEYDEKYRFKHNKIINDSCLYCKTSFNDDIGEDCECGANKPFEWAKPDHYITEYLGDRVYHNQYGINLQITQQIHNTFTENNIILSFNEEIKYKEIFQTVFNHFKSKNRKNIKYKYILNKIFTLMNREDAAKLFNVK